MPAEKDAGGSDQVLSIYFRTFAESHEDRFAREGDNIWQSNACASSKRLAQLSAETGGQGESRAGRHKAASAIYD